MNEVQPSGHSKCQESCSSINVAMCGDAQVRAGEQYKSIFRKKLRGRGVLNTETERRTGDEFCCENTGEY